MRDSGKMADATGALASRGRRVPKRGNGSWPVSREAETPSQAEANLSALIESTQDLIWSVDLDFRLISFNRAMQQNIQDTFRARLAVGMRLHELFPPERAVLWPPFYARVLAEGPFRVEYSLLDGLTLELAFNPIVVNGEATGISVFGKDITEWKAAEESRRFLAEVVESCEDAIITYAPSGEILTWNRGAEAIYGYSADEAIGKPLSMFIAPERREVLDRISGQLLGGAPKCHVQGRGLRKNGVKFHFSVTAWPIRNSAGEVTAICTIIRDVSARHEAEENRALLASVVESSGDAVHAFNLDGTVASWNLGAERLTGYTSEEILGKHVAILASSGLKGQVRQNLRIIRDGCTAGPSDVVFRRKDGTGIDVSLILTPIRNSDGEVVGGAAIARDITERKRTEMQLRDSEERYRTTFEQAAVGIIHASFEGRILRCNARIADILGYTAGELAGLTVQQITAPDDLADSAELMRRVANGASAEALDKRYIRKDGALTWVKLTLSIQRDTQGRPLHFAAIIEDINARKAAEARLAAASGALRESEERYRTVFQTSPDAIIITRLDDGMFVDVNEALLTNTGYAREEVVGHTVWEVNIWANSDDRKKMLGSMRQNSKCRNLEARFRKKDGTFLWGLLLASAIELNGVPCILSVTRDITDAKAAEERLAAAVKALRMSEERYRTAFQTSLDAINISRIDDGKFIDCNRAFLNAMGFEREEVLGRTSLDLGIWADARDRQTMAEMLRRDASCRGLEVQLRKKDGKICWGEMSASVIEIDGVPCILSITRDISAAKAAESTIRSLAFYDPLTGLPNRRHLLERLRQPLDADARSGRSHALLLVDLDHFKTLNDTLGHQTGDLLLQEVARRIAACAHEADTVCRLGGDEFVIVLEDLSKVAEEAAAQAKAVGEKVLAAIDQPCMIEDHECLSTASIGIAVLGDRKDSTDEILQQAEIALYQAKAAGRNTLRFFSPALQAAVNARAALEEDLRQGIKAKQLLLYYQPQVERGRLTGAEALVRWMHPRYGIVEPNDFIPLAEESRLILPLGDWVLETACAQIASWAGRKETAHLSIAVNISALQFRQPEFVEQVLTTLSRTGANPENLRLELTESMLADNLEDIIAKMTELKSHGLRFALDDFGTGYSSLSYLKRLPLDRLKIDRSFVRDMLVDATSGAIAQAILSLGHAMGLSVIAEGVETEEQRGYLAGLGCHSFQGFLFSRPLPLKQFEDFLHGFAESGDPRLAGCACSPGIL